MKTRCKQILAAFCCLAVLIPALCGSVLPALAEDAYFETEDGGVLYFNVGQSVLLEDIALLFGEETVSGKDLTFSCADDAVQISEDAIKITEKGMFELNVEGGGRNAAVTVLTKNEDETEFVLYEEDFESIPDGGLPEGWIVSLNNDVTEDGSLKHPTYVDSPQVRNGVLYVGNGVVNNAYSLVYLPEFLDRFGDYQVELDAKQSYVFDNMKMVGVILRASREKQESGLPTEGYSIPFRRSQAGNQAMGINDLATPSQAASGKGPFPLGSTRNWATTTNWKPEGYDMHFDIRFSGTDFTIDYYRPTVQEQFGGDMGPQGGGQKWNTYFLQDDPLLSDHEFETSIKEWTNVRKNGAVVLMGIGAQFAVDSLRITVPANMLSANPDKYGEDELDPNLASYQSQKIGVISDVHIQLMATDPDKTLKFALNKLKEEGVSVILAAGDVVNTSKVEEYDKFFSIWNEVFPDAETAPQLLAITGNHEFEQAYYGRETVEDVYERYMTAFGYDEVNFHKVVNGIHIIGLNSETAAVNGGYTAKTTDWLSEQLAAAKADDPYAPILVMVHQSLKNTTYGSLWGSGNTGALYDVLAEYPQVVYLAGHSHFASENEMCIMQKDFTCVDIPSLQRTCVEDGNGGSFDPSDGFQSQGFLMLELKGEEKELDIHRYKVDKTSGAIREIKTPWTLSLPITRKGFTYKADRADSREAPVFPAGSEVTIENVTSNSATIRFPAATHDDYVHAYYVEVTDASGASLLSKYMVSDFYVYGSKKSTFEADLEGLPSNTKFFVSVRAAESFGKKSEPITGEATTKAISSLSAGRNVADFFDVDIAAGFEDNSPYRRQYSLYVKSHPIKLIQDEELGRQVAYMGGWVNYPSSQGSLKEITEHFTIELAFRTPDEEITAGQCLFGNPESGGITVEYTGAGVFQVGAHIGGGYKYVQVPDLALSTWYHLIYVFDGQTSKVYIDGEFAAETASVGTVYFNPTVNWLTIGANVNAAGNAAYVFKGHIALARVYTAPMSAEEAAAAYTAFGKDGFMNALYQKYLALYNQDTSVMKAEDAQAVETMLDKASGLLDRADLTEEEAEACIGEINDLLISLMAYDEKAPLAMFHDKMDDFTKIKEKSESGIQWENNTEIKRTLISKNSNTDVYLIYKLPGSVRYAELDFLTVAAEQNPAEDFHFFVSNDGVEWTEVPYTFTEPVPNAINAYWAESTASISADGEFSYLKVQLNKFGKYVDSESGKEANRCNWSTVLDDLRVWYLEPGVILPEPGPEPTYKFGDVDGNGIVNAKDYQILKRYILKSLATEPDEAQLARMDINGDKRWNGTDYQILKRYILGTYNPPQ